MNGIGIMQHHDAITGTARWKVNLDYQNKMNYTQEMTNSLYASFVGDRSEEVLGLRTIQSWDWCSLEYDGHLKCPPRDKDDLDYIVAVHNPSV